MLIEKALWQQMKESGREFPILGEHGGRYIISGVEKGKEAEAEAYQASRRAEDRVYSNDLWIRCHNYDIMP